MKASGKISVILVLAIVSVVVVGTYNKVIGQHKEKLLQVASSKIEEAARDCYLDGVCTGETTTLENLINFGYLGSQVHPISKEFISGSLVIACQDFACTTDLN